MRVYMIEYVPDDVIGANDETENEIYFVAGKSFTHAARKAARKLGISYDNVVSVSDHTSGIHKALASRLLCNLPEENGDVSAYLEALFSSFEVDNHCSR